MATKPDFTQIDTGRRVYADIEQATGKKRQQTTVGEEEAARREAIMQTQGRKGCKMPRMNIAFSTDNWEYARIMARATGQTFTAFVNTCIEEHRKEHPEALTLARSLVKMINTPGGGAADQEGSDQEE